MYTVLKIMLKIHTHLNSYTHTHTHFSVCLSLFSLSHTQYLIIDIVADTEARTRGRFQGIWYSEFGSQISLRHGDGTTTITGD